MRSSVTAWLIVVREKLRTRAAGDALAVAARERAAGPAAESAAVKRLRRETGE